MRYNTCCIVFDPRELRTGLLKMLKKGTNEYGVRYLWRVCDEMDLSKKFRPPPPHHLKEKNSVYHNIWYHSFMKIIVDIFILCHEIFLSYEAPLLKVTENINFLIFWVIDKNSLSLAYKIINWSRNRFLLKSWW